MLQLYYLLFIIMSKVYSNKSTNGSKYKPKQKYKIKLIGGTIYHPLIQNDTINQQNIYRLVNSQFKFAISSILRDLNFLLKLTQQQFFQEISTSQTLKVCLQSCLVCLPKQQYNRLSIRSTQQIKDQHLNLTYYQGLLKVVLFIYHRISYTQNQNFKNLIYQQWLLDVPKMIDLSLIYVCKKEDQTYSNLQIIRNIIEKTIKSNYINYREDIKDFITFLYNVKIETVLQHLDIGVDLQNLSTARKSFKDPLRSFLISANKTLFSIKDLFIVLQHFYLCFPKQFVRQLATDHQIQQSLIKIYIKLLKNSKDWKLSKLKHCFQLNIISIKEKIINFMKKNLSINIKILKQSTNKNDQTYIRALTTYNYYAMYFSNRQLYSQQFQKFIKQFISQLYPQRLFFIEELPNIQNVKFNEKQKFGVLKSVQLQGKIRSYIESSTVESQINNEFSYLQQQYKSESSSQSLLQKHQQDILRYVPQKKDIIWTKNRQINQYFDDFDDSSYNIQHQLPKNNMQLKLQQIKRNKNIPAFYKRRLLINENYKQEQINNLNLSFKEDNSSISQSGIQKSLSFQIKQSQFNFSNISSIIQNLSQVNSSKVSDNSLLIILKNQKDKDSVRQQQNFQKQSKIHYDYQKKEINEKTQYLQQHDTLQQNDEEQNMSFQYYDSEEQSLSFD